MRNDAAQSSVSNNLGEDANKDLKNQKNLKMKAKLIIMNQSQKMKRNQQGLAKV